LRDKFLSVWAVWNFALKRESRIGFLASMALIDILIGAPAYLITNHLMNWRGTTVFDPVTSIDLAIPFMAWTIVIYQSLFFLFYPLPLFSLPKEKKMRYEALILSQSLLVIIILSNIWFVIFPAEVHLRDSIDVNNMHPIFSSMYETLWFFDSPYNSWPSLHVSSAGIFTLFAIRWWKDKPILQWSIGISWILMSLSILTTKQHFILDLVTAVILLAAVWKWKVLPCLENLENMSVSRYDDKVLENH